MAVIRVRCGQVDSTNLLAQQHGGTRLELLNRIMRSRSTVAIQYVKFSGRETTKATFDFTKPVERCWARQRSFKRAFGASIK